MKTTKYLVFLSILSPVFIIIYWQSDKKGCHRWWRSFKASVLMVASVAGLLPSNIGSMEPPGTNSQVYQERLLNDQDFNSFKDNGQKIILVKRWVSKPSVPTLPGIGQSSQFPKSPALPAPNF